MIDVAHLVAPLLGGVLIGVAIALLLLFDGRVAGISGVLAGLLGASSKERTWRAFFVGGLLAGGLVAHTVAPEAIGPMEASLPVLALAGLLVGFGTRLAGGCTSGHGVCGTSRLSRRSLAATGTFMVLGAAVVLFVRHGLTR